MASTSDGNIEASAATIPTTITAPSAAIPTENTGTTPLKFNITDIEKFKIPKLQGENNYIPWSIRIEVILDTNSVLHAIT
jgi:hypothetical protein